MSIGLKSCDIDSKNKESLLPIGGFKWLLFIESMSAYNKIWNLHSVVVGTVLLATLGVDMFWLTYCWVLSFGCMIQ